MSVNEKMTAIADALRDKTGKTEKLTLAQIPTEIDDVYEAGKKAEQDSFWSSYTGTSGKGKDWRRKFANPSWVDEIFNPPFTKITATLYAGSMFQNSGIKDGLKKLTEIDISETNVDTSSMSNWAAASSCTYFPVLKFPSSCDLYQVFNWCQLLVTIEKLVIDETNTFLNTFNNCISLQNIIVDGIIGASIGFPHSPLTRESITNVIEHLSETATGKTVTFKKSAKEAAFTEDEWAELTSTKPNWTFSLL